MRRRLRHEITVAVRVNEKARAFQRGPLHGLRTRIVGARIPIIARPGAHGPRELFLTRVDGFAQILGDPRGARRRHSGGRASSHGRLLSGRARRSRGACCGYHSCCSRGGLWACHVRAIRARTEKYAARCFAYRLVTDHARSVETAPSG